MIHTTFSDMFANYIWVLLAVVGCVWVAGEWRRLRRWRRERQFEVVCRLCGEVFRDVTAKPLVACPCCQAVNERQRPREI